MKYICFILLISVCFSCKRKRKIAVEGTVTDTYTRQPAKGVNVQLYSFIEQSAGGGSYNTYEAITDNTGHFNFKNAVFSKPENSGGVKISDPKYIDINSGESSQHIGKSDIKFIGKTNLTRNLEVICLSSLNLSLNISSSIDVTSATFYRKFSGSGPVPAMFSEFNEVGTWKKTPTPYDYFPNKLIGYSDGINIIKTDYFDALSGTQKTTYDTLVSRGCGSVNSYTINLN